MMLFNCIKSPKEKKIKLINLKFKTILLLLFYFSFV